MANTTINTITINGKVYEGKIDLVESLIKSGLITEVGAVRTEEKSEKGGKKGKNEDWFDREKYLELGEKFNAIFVAKSGKHKGEKKVYAWARPSIYAIMRGELTMAKAKTQISKAKKASEEKYGKKTA